MDKNDGKPRVRNSAMRNAILQFTNNPTGLPGLEPRENGEFVDGERILNSAFLAKFIQHLLHLVLGASKALSTV